MRHLRLFKLQVITFNKVLFSVNVPLHCFNALLFQHVIFLFRAEWIQHVDVTSETLYPVKQVFLKGAKTAP